MDRYHKSDISFLYQFLKFILISSPSVRATSSQRPVSNLSSLSWLKLTGSPFSHQSFNEKNGIGHMCTRARTFLAASQESCFSVYLMSVVRHRGCQISSDDKYSSFITGFLTLMVCLVRLRSLRFPQGHISLTDAFHVRSHVPVRWQVSSYNK